MLLLIMVWYTVLMISNAVKHLTLITAYNDTLATILWQQFENFSNTLQPATTLLFSCKYFDSVTGFVKSKTKGVFFINVVSIILIVAIFPDLFITCVFLVARYVRNRNNQKYLAIRSMVLKVRYSQRVQTCTRYNFKPSQCSADVTDCVAIEKTGPRIESRERRFTRHQDQRTCCRLPYFVFVSANSDLCTVGIPQPF